MKISENTLSILKNFTTINPSIHIRTGNVLKTISPRKTIYAMARVEEEFDREFAIYDLNRFNSVVSTLKNPEFEFLEKYVKISSENSSFTYFYADPSMIFSAPEKSPKLPSEDFKFKLSAADLDSLNKAWNILQVSEFSIVGKNNKLFLTVKDTKNPTGDSFSISLDVTEGYPLKEFTAIISCDNLKLIKGTYDVSISAKGFCKFESEAVTYFISLEDSSKLL